ncbi:uncharacterized protein AMSG_12025 [Thecamonas trahens ATCC 50062]|uniref:Coronin n=1 Tax=Thecamonas trahens ATCC 50062 TaxID=461836 RepID=A0A0L0DFB8_THETB|nr:hypothetical protein AMSG_12025 [Thecamonas trahens ATCC 50062]KNC51042.1 hypothetical protein AMSG_12025 [Thecamonas trahens ATCC 50062]|eukprot:XP_013756556.1 hypothetical protein AMSG_12025 [Thecamonas trahens ATCC 50062]
MLAGATGIAAAAGWQRTFAARRTKKKSAGVAKEAVYNETDPEAVIPTLVRLEKVLGKEKAKLELPKIVVVGNQSSGKSSVLEAVAGFDFLPKSTSMCTTRPLELNLLRSDSGTWAEFDDGRKIFDFEQVEAILREKNQDEEFSELPVTMSIYAPHVYNVSLIDLPGYIHAVRAGQSPELPERIAALCQKYISDPNNIIVAVASAADDVAMSMGIKNAQAVDANMDRSLGVLTKMDLIKSRKHIHSILRNEDYPLGLGYVGVRCRSQKELEDGKSFDDVLRIEEAFIRRAKLRDVGDLRLGIPTLRRVLSEEQLNKVAADFPRILAELDQHIDDVAKDEQFLLAISAETDLRNIARELEKLVLKFSPLSPERLEFEAQVRDTIGDIVHNAWFDAMDKFFEFSDPPSPLASPQLSARLTEAYKPTNDELHVQKTARRALTDVDFEPESHFVDRRGKFERALVFGTGTPDKIDDATLARLGDHALIDGALAPFYKYVFPENANRARPVWQEALEDSVDAVLSDAHLVDRCRRATVDQLLEFVDRTAHAGTGRESRLALHFFRYLVKRISTEINSDGLSSHIEGMIAREKRATVSYPVLMAETAELLRSPKTETGLGFWGALTNSAKWPLVIPLYGQVFTSAYFGAVIDRSTSDVFRSLAVEMLNPLIIEAIHYSLNLFKGHKIRRESKRQLQYLNQLKKYRAIIASAQARYTPSKPAPGSASSSSSYSELRTTSLAGDCNEVAASGKYVAFGGSSARSISFLPVGGSGRFGSGQGVPGVAGHSRNISALDFSPFHDALLVTAAEDGSVKIWELGEGKASVSETASAWSASQKRIQALAFNPVADGVLATAAADGVVKVWDVNAEAELCAAPSIECQPQSLAWDYAGATLVVTAKDKTVRVYDLRASADGPVASGPGHDGIKATRVTWMGDSSRFVTTGFDKYRSREVRVYDMASSLDAPISKTKMDSSSGILMPLYDADTKLLFLGGKGDVALRFYEDDGGKLLEAGSVGSREQISGLALAPKRVLNVWDCEVARVLKLTAAGAVVPVSYKVPRKSYAKFHPELYPETRGTTPGATAPEWASGANGSVALVSLQPEGERPTPSLPSSSMKSTSSGKTNSAGKTPPPVAARAPVARKWGAGSGGGGSKWGAGGSGGGGGSGGSKWGAKRSSWSLKAKEEAPAESEKESDPDAPPEGMREVVVPKNVVRVSKFRHIVGSETKKELWTTGLRINDNFSVDSSMVAASDALVAVPWKGAGGVIGVFPRSHVGRVDVDMPTISQSSIFNAFDFSPFNGNLLATGSDDGRVGLWEIPSTGLAAPLTEASATMEGHRHRVTWLTWAPYVENLLATGSFDSTVRLWDVEQQACLVSMDSFEAEPTGVAFAYDSATIASSARDKKLRLHDPRADGSVVASVADAHVGVKPFKLVWLGAGDKLATVGFGERSKREIKVWDMRALDAPVATKPLTTSSNLALPFYDVQTGVLFLAGKGDGSINTFEINEKGIHELAPYTATNPQSGLALLPKSCVDVAACEFASFVKLSGSAISSVTFKVPRSRKELFQDDVFVPVPGFEPAATAAVFLDAVPGAPPLHDMRPEGMPLLSEAAPTTKKPVRKWVPTTVEKVDTRSAKDKLMDSFESKLNPYQEDASSSRPAANRDAAAAEDW